MDHTGQKMDTTRQKVLQCIIDLDNAQRPASRQLIAQYLNEKLTVVDDAVKRLIEDGLVRKVVAGIVAPVHQFPPDDAISKTVLPSGRVKLEKGDDVMEFTPHEAAVVGKMFQGEAMEMAYWYEERQHGDTVARLQAEVRRLQSVVQHMRLTLQPPRHGIQRDLFGEKKPARRRRPQPEKETMQ